MPDQPPLGVPRLRQLPGHFSPLSPVGRGHNAVVSSRSFSCCSQTPELRKKGRDISHSQSLQRETLLLQVPSISPSSTVVFSPALPQPPPYPGPRDESLSSLLSSSNSLPVPGPSTYHNYTNNCNASFNYSEMTFSPVWHFALGVFG